MDPFRDELAAAHAKIAQLEEQLRNLQERTRRMPQPQPEPTPLVIGRGTLAMVAVASAFIALAVVLVMYIVVTKRVAGRRVSRRRNSGPRSHAGDSSHRQSAGRRIGICKNQIEAVQLHAGRSTVQLLVRGRAIS